MASTPLPRQFDVLVGNTLVGYLRFTHDGRREHSTFEYAREWLAVPARYEIDPTLPLVSGPQFPPYARIAGSSRFHGVIADTEPDGWARRVILRDHAKRRQAAKARGETLPAMANALDFLLAVDDHSRVGALRFRDEHGVCQRALEPGRRTAPPLVELPDLLRATRAVEQQSETLADLEYLRGRGTSLGGMRPKCSVRDKRWGLCIGKFPSVADERPCTKGEVLALRLARQAGIQVADARLVDSDGIAVALIRRFDREVPRSGHGGPAEDAMEVPDAGNDRLLFVSAATLMGLAPDDQLEHAYTEIADVIRQRSADAKADLEELWRRVAFSILITNIDDHLHNHGFLHVEGALWRLSPAFDINPFPERIRELKTWISEDTGPEASITALMSTTKYFGLSARRAAEILHDVEHAVANWRNEAVRLGFTRDELESFADAFEHHERVVTRQVLNATSAA
jgi:serine/threonine-protein kinase HipA